MSWTRMPGIEGLVWVPERAPGARRKHNCGDCFSCRMCSDACCSECLKRKAHVDRLRGTARRKK